MSGGVYTIDQPISTLEILQKTHRTLWGAGTAQESELRLQTEFSCEAYGCPDGYVFGFTNNDYDRVVAQGWSQDPRAGILLRIFHGHDFDSTINGVELRPHEGHGFSYETHYRLAAHGLLSARAFRVMSRSNTERVWESKPLELPLALLSEFVSQQMLPSGNSWESGEVSPRGNKEIGAKHGWNVTERKDPEVECTGSIDPGQALDIHAVPFFPIRWRVKRYSELGMVIIDLNVTEEEFEEAVRDPRVVEVLKQAEAYGKQVEAEGRAKYLER